MPTRKALALKNRNTMLHVSTLMTREATKVISQGAGLGQQEMGGFLRSVVPGIIGRYGNVNAVTAADYYDKTRALFASTKKPYTASLPVFDSVLQSETIINYGMATFMASFVISVETWSIVLRFLRASALRVGIRRQVWD